MNAAIDALRRRFVERCHEDRSKLTHAASVGDTDALKLMSHKLAGAAGTFGYADLSAAAAAVEDEIDEGRTPDRACLQRLDDALTRTAADQT